MLIIPINVPFKWEVEVYLSDTISDIVDVLGLRELYPRNLLRRIGRPNKRTWRKAFEPAFDTYFRGWREMVENLPEPEGRRFLERRERMRQKWMAMRPNSGYTWLGDRCEDVSSQAVEAVARDCYLDMFSATLRRMYDDWKIERGERYTTA